MKHIQYLIDGILVFFGFLFIYIIGFAMIGIPILIAVFTNNYSWLWLYVISGIILFYFIGRQLNETK